MPALILFQFKKDNTFEKRKAEAHKVMARYPDAVPVIVEKMPGAKIPQLGRKKFLVTKQSPVYGFKEIIRHYLKLPREEPLYLFVDMKIPPTKEDMGALYKEFCEEDNMLYLHYGTQML